MIFSINDLILNLSPLNSPNELHTKTILDIIYFITISQIGKQCKPVQVHSFFQFRRWLNFQKLLVGATSPIPFERHL